ncbi:hypothetical protein, partial [Spirosoma sp.]|uniref:hypothetical protein n=1 Tax=Spirosoma sp. TaxID=1899569 RepID=UPI003B3A1A44
ASDNQFSSMKTLTAVTGGIVGLYGILTIYLVVVGNGSNSDPAGRGMIGGIAVLLLLFAGLLAFLNLRDSRIAIISATLIGGLPLLLFGKNLLNDITASDQSEEEYVATAVEEAPDTDSTAVTQTVLDFLHWYKANLQSISQIDLVNQQPGENYSVNARNSDRYLTYLKTSELLTENYINEWRTFFQDRQAGFLATPQQEGLPTGFDYDLVMLTQNIDMLMDSLETVKVNSVQTGQNQASVQFFLLEEYEFRLVKEHDRWLINEILNLSAE